MSIKGTRSKDNGSNLFFGLAELYIGDSASNITQTSYVLTEGNYFGCLVKVSFKITRKFLERYGSFNGVNILTDLVTTNSSFSISVNFVELSEQSLSYAFGGDGSDTNLLDNIFSSPQELRAELVFTYPNKTNKMILVLPKVKVNTKTLSFGFAPEKPIQVPMSLVPLHCSDTAWASNPIGKIIFE